MNDKRRPVVYANPLFERNINSNQLERALSLSLRPAGRPKFCEQSRAADYQNRDELYLHNRCLFLHEFEIESESPSPINL